MAENKDLKTRLQDVYVALKHLFKPEQLKEQPKKVLNQAMLEKEIQEFAKTKGYNLNDATFDLDKFQEELAQYLRNKNYSFERLNASINSENSDKKVGAALLPKRIYTISEDLNDCVKKLMVFADTTNMMPGLICYTIEKIEQKKLPYITYRPTARVITQIHDSGVNGGTIFFSYKHRFSKLDQFKDIYGVVSEDEVIYSPLTKEQAEYICKLLNTQSRLLYQQKMKEIMKQRQIREQKTK